MLYTKMAALFAGFKQLPFPVSEGQFSSNLKKKIDVLKKEQYFHSAFFWFSVRTTVSALIIHHSSEAEYCNHCLKSCSYILVAQISKKTADASAMSENSTSSQNQGKKQTSFEFREQNSCLYLKILYSLCYNIVSLNHFVFFNEDCILKIQIISMIYSLILGERRKEERGQRATVKSWCNFFVN